MLEDYSRYLEDIRNGLIQCGVTFSDVRDVGKMDYTELFQLSEVLADIMYFYNIMSYSGNIDGLFLRRSEPYVGYVKSETFKEFKEDILPMLKEQFGDDSDEDIDFESLLGTGDSVEEPEEWVNEELPVEDMLFEVDDLFSDEDYEVEKGTDIAEQFSSSGAELWSVDTKEYTSHGTDLFGTGKKSVEEPQKEELKEELVEEPREYVSHGVDLFSIKNESKQDYSNQSDKGTPDVEYVPHGVDLFSIQVAKKSDEDLWESEEGYKEADSSEEESKDENIWEEPTEDSLWEEEPAEDSLWEEPEEENIWEEPDEEEVDTPKDSGDDDSLWSEDSEDIWVEEEEPVDSSAPEGKTPEDDGIQWDDSDEVEWYEDPVEEQVAKPTPKPAVQKPTVAKPSVPIVPTVSTDEDEEQDIVDIVQKKASEALTSAKKFLLNITNPKN